MDDLITFFAWICAWLLGCLLAEQIIIVIERRPPSDLRWPVALTLVVGVILQVLAYWPRFWPLLVLFYILLATLSAVLRIWSSPGERPRRFRDHVSEALDLPHSGRPPAT